MNTVYSILQLIMTLLSHRHKRGSGHNEYSIRSVNSYFVALWTDPFMAMKIFAFIIENTIMIYLIE